MPYTYLLCIHVSTLFTLNYLYGVMVPFEEDVEVASFKATGNFIEHLLPHIFIIVPSLGISVVNA